MRGRNGDRVGPVVDRLGVVIVAHNSSAVIGELLDSLPLGLAGTQAQVVVVDNGSEDDTAGLVSRRPDVDLILSTNDGYAAGVNLGIASLRACSMFLILNPDTRVLPGAAARLIAAAREDPSVGIVVPRIENLSGLDFSLRREPTLARSLGLSRFGRPDLAERVSTATDYDLQRDVDWAVGAALLVTRDCYDAVGCWDESFFLYSEETEFCLAARDRGFRTRYEPSATVFHLEGGSGRSPETHAMQAINRVRLYRRRHSAAVSGAYLLVTAAHEALWSLRGEPKSPFALEALLRPSSRPERLNASQRWLPR